MNIFMRRIFCPLAAFFSFFFFFFLFLSHFEAAEAASKISAGIEVRERLETWDSYNKKAYGDDSINPKGKRQGDPDDDFILQRVICGVGGESDTFSWRAYLYDSRSWGTSLDKEDFIKNRDTGQEYTMDPYEDYIEPYELYVKFKGLGTENSSLTLGRQIIGYGDKRIFGPGSVTNSVGWIWDAARYSLQYKESFLDFWYGQTKDQDPDTLSLFERHPNQGVGVYGHWPAADLITLEPFFSWKKGNYESNGRKENTYYFGARLYRENKKGFIYDVTLAKELGQFIGAQDSPHVDSEGYAIKAGWFFKDVFLSPKLMLARIYASGDPDPDDDEINTYTRPFGTTDGGFYGIMDLMSWSNMVDNQLDFRFNIWSEYNLRICYHDFYLDEKADKWAYFGYQVADNRYDHVGNEIDFILTGKPVDWLDFMLFYGHFDAGDFVTKNDISQDNADRIVLELVFHFSYP
jgi:hypothetical protein